MVEDPRPPVQIVLERDLNKQAHDIINAMVAQMDMVIRKARNQLENYQKVQEKDRVSIEDSIKFKIQISNDGDNTEVKIKIKKAPKKNIEHIVKILGEKA